MPWDGDMKEPKNKSLLNIMFEEIWYFLRCLAWAASGAGVGSYPKRDDDRCWYCGRDRSK